MTFTESVKTCFQKYIVFSGRASRSEYWWFFLFALVLGVVTSWIPFIGFIVVLALLLPSLSVTVRRLHDTNRTGWWVLLPTGSALGGVSAGAVAFFAGLAILGLILMFLGFVGGYLVLLYFLIQPGNPGPNRYGPNPLQQPGAGGIGYYQDPGYPYSPSSPAGSYSESPYDPSLPDSRPEPEPEGRLFCSQCGMQLQPGARFCTVCGTEA